MNKLSINYIGFLDGDFGLANAAKSNIQALEKRGIEVKKINFSYKEKTQIEEHDNLITIIHINPDGLFHLFDDIDLHSLENKYLIAFWAWEFSEIPLETKKYITFFNEIWTPSNFCVDAFSKNSIVPVIRIPHSIQEKVSYFSKKELQIPENKFIYLTIFDADSYVERKNPFTTITAFEKIFHKNNQEACLIIKTKNLSRFESILKRITDISNNNSSIILIDEKFSNEKLDSLLIHSDCLISLHRSEGFGLTMAEAMQLGKPVIATAYSGNLDFMNSFNSYLVNYKLIEVKEDFGLIKRGMIWADPIMSDASEKIKQVFDNQKKATEVGKIAYDTISKNLSLESIGIKMEERLNFINTVAIEYKNKEKFKQKINQLEIKNTILEKRIKYLEKTLYNKIRKSVNNFFSKLKGER